MDFRHLLEKAKNLEKAMSELTERLKTHISEGSAGAGAVVVKVNGGGDVVSLVMDPELLATGDKDLIEHTLLAALGQATEASRIYREEQRSALVGGLKLPDF
jgi:DNA-binding YbaB/EbfC family protein